MNFVQKEPPIVFKDEDLQELEFSSEFLDFETCILRLKESHKIECLLIKNCSLRITNIYYLVLGEFVELSSFNFDQNLEEIIISFDSKITTNAIKIVFSASCVKEVDFAIFERKIKGLIVATRYDLFGGRLNSMLNAMYLASKSGLKFGFVWEERIPPQNDKNCSFVEKEEKFFTKEFLSQHSYTKTLNVGYDGGKLTFSSITELMENENMQKRWGYRCVANYILSKQNLSDLDYEDYREQLPKLFDSIGFLPSYKQVFANAKNQANKIGGFVAIHMRGGDAIYTNTYRKLIFMGGIMARVFPVEFVIHLINGLLDSSNIVIFSEDFDCAKEIKKSFSNHKGSYRVYINEDLIENCYTKYEKDFFDFYLMSLAKEIFVPNYSTFSLLSAMIGKNSVKTLDQSFSLEEQFGIIIQNFDQINVHCWQKAASLAYLYRLCLKLGKDLQTKMNILQKALYYDEDNSAYRMKILEELFAALQIQEVENNLKEWISKRKQEFLETLFRRYPGDKESPYKILYPLIQQNASSKYGYISFVAAQIAIFQRDFKSALKYAEFAYEAEPQNEIFQKHLLTLLLQKEKEQSALKPKVITKEVVKEVIKENPIPSIYLVAKDRIHNHLAYKLGQAMILNSKSLLGYIRMPYVLSYIKESHRIEQQKYQEKIKKNPSLKLPKLESYPDYKEVLREKQCFTYKLGEALIKANSVRGGGANICLPCLFPKSA